MKSSCINQKPLDIVNEILTITEDVNAFQDVDAILDKILYESRRICNADAGTIFLVEGDRLRFSYVHNDTLIGSQEGNELKYADYTVAMDSSSIVGHAAVMGEMVHIRNAYNLPEGCPFEFNTHFDEVNNYRTVSILAIPLYAAASRLVGVMQLINAMDAEGRITPFSEASREYLPLLTRSAASTIERGHMTRELVLRMMRMAELHDPKETAVHVLRVSAYAGEIYNRWALMKGVADETRRRVCDILRLTSMLHDVGKVGITDAILKKPAKLTPEEFKVMQLHTIYGARLFAQPASALDKMAKDVILGHHERWDGGGYPGEVEDINAENVQMGKGIAGDAIPVAARVVAVADVFDALSSKRCYKDSWEEDAVLEYMQEHSGTQFDPDMIQALLDIYDVIKAIQNKFRDEDHEF